MTKPIGFVGIGTMGGGLARALSANGQRVLAYDLNQTALTELTQVDRIEGAQSLVEFGERCELVLTCLPDDVAVRNVYQAAEGLQTILDKGTVSCDLSTISPALSTELEEQAIQNGIQHTTAAMLGSKTQADQGAVFLIVGGAESALQKILPILTAISRDLHVVGDCATASKIKLLHNALGAFNYAAVAESLLFARACGVNLQSYYDVVSNGGGMAYGNYFGRKALKIIEGDYTPHFKLGLGHKDSLLCRDLLADKNVPMPLHDLSRAYLDQAYENEDREQDVSVITRSVEKRTGVSLADKK